MFIFPLSIVSQVQNVFSFTVPSGFSTLASTDFYIRRLTLLFTTILLGILHLLPDKAS